MQYEHKATPTHAAVRSLFSTLPTYSDWGVDEDEMAQASTLKATNPACRTIVFTLANPSR